MATAVSTDDTGTSGRIDSGGDADFFSFAAEIGNVYRIQTTGSTDTFLFLLEQDGNTIIDLDDDSGPELNAFIEWTATATGTFFVVVEHFSSAGTGPYILTIEESQGANVTATYFVNPADPRLVQSEVAPGSTVTWFGDKDDEGRATFISGFQVDDTENGKTLFTNDSFGRPLTIVSPSGAVFEIDYTGGSGTPVITAISPDGTVQVNTTLETKSEVISTPSSSIRKNDRIETEFLPGVMAPAREDEAYLATVLNGKLSKGGVGNVTTSVTNCGEPEADATVTWTVRSDLTGTNILSDAQSVPGANGTYTLFFPVRSADEITTSREQLCEGVEDAVNGSCDLLSNSGLAADQFCAAVAGALAGVTGPGAILLLAECELIVVAAQLACSAAGTVNLDCDSINIEDAFTGQNDTLTFTPTVTVPGKLPVTLPSQTASLAGPFPSFTHEVGDDPAIGAFRTSPVDPQPGQDYLAEAEILCVPSGTSVVIGVVGTDGFTDSRTETISGNGSVALSVPGAAAGIRDTISVGIIVAPEVTRTISVVF